MEDNAGYPELRAAALEQQPFSSGMAAGLMQHARQPKAAYKLCMHRRSDAMHQPKQLARCRQEELTSTGASFLFFAMLTIYKSVGTIS